MAGARTIISSRSCERLTILGLHYWTDSILVRMTLATKRKSLTVQFATAFVE
jgi:hypothetical protein